MNRQSHPTLRSALSCRRDGETFLESLTTMGNVATVGVGRRRREMSNDVPRMPLGAPSWFVRTTLADGRIIEVEAGRLEDAALLALLELAEVV